VLLAELRDRDRARKRWSGVWSGAAGSAHRRRAV